MSLETGWIVTITLAGLIALTLCCLMIYCIYYSSYRRRTIILNVKNKNSKYIPPKLSTIHSGIELIPKNNNNTTTNNNISTQNDNQYIYLARKSAFEQSSAVPSDLKETESDLIFEDMYDTQPGSNNITKGGGYDQMSTNNNDRNTAKSIATDHTNVSNIFGHFSPKNMKNVKKSKNFYQN